MIAKPVGEGGSTTPTLKDTSRKIKYIVFFIIFCILISSVAGKRSLYYFLILVLLGQVLGYWNKYDINFSTPEIFKQS